MELSIAMVVMVDCVHTIVQIRRLSWLSQHPWQLFHLLSEVQDCQIRINCLHFPQN
jgi:hypothetical protein